MGAKETLTRRDALADRIIFYNGRAWDAPDRLDALVVTDAPDAVQEALGISAHAWHERPVCDRKVTYANFSTSDPLSIQELSRQGYVLREVNEDSAPALAVLDAFEEYVAERGRELRKESLDLRLQRLSFLTDNLRDNYVEPLRQACRRPESLRDGPIYDLGAAWDLFEGQFAPADAALRDRFRDELAQLYIDTVATPDMPAELRDNRIAHIAALSVEDLRLAAETAKTDRSYEVVR